MMPPMKPATMALVGVGIVGGLILISRRSAAAAAPPGTGAAPGTVPGATGLQPQAPPATPAPTLQPLPSPIVQTRPMAITTNATSDADRAQVTQIAQAQLLKLGYDVPINGMSDARTQAAVTQFYADHRADIDERARQLGDATGDRALVVYLDDMFRQQTGAPSVTAMQDERRSATPAASARPMRAVR